MARPAGNGEGRPGRRPRPVTFITSFMRIHLDTDLGGDIDDLCALALLLHLPGLELTGITTVAEHAGRRAGYVRSVLQLAGRQGIPVAAGADASLGVYREWPGL